MTRPASVRSIDPSQHAQHIADVCTHAKAELAPYIERDDHANKSICWTLRLHTGLGPQVNCRPGGCSPKCALSLRDFDRRRKQRQ